MSINGVFFQVYRQITTGEIQLPGLPDVAMQVRRAVRDEQNDLNTVVRIIQADPGLSANLVRVANSPLYRTRVQAENLASSVLTSKCRGFDPHSAMLAGLLQEIGALPLLNQLEKQANLTDDKNALREQVAKLTPQIGAVLLEKWGFDERYVEVARRRDAWDHDPDASVDLADLVLMARLHSFIGTPKMHKVPRIDQVTAYHKLPLGELSPHMSLVMLDEAGQDIEEVRELLIA